MGFGRDWRSGRGSREREEMRFLATKLGINLESLAAADTAGITG